MGQQSLDDWRCDVNIGEAHDAPTGKRGRKVFLQVGHEPCWPVVATPDPDSALDFDQRAAREMGEVSAPTALLIKAELPFKRWAAGCFPKLVEFCFES